MPCYHPSKVSVVRRTVGDGRPDDVTVPCGKCLGCRTSQAREWAIRIMHEAVIMEHAFMVTLTYDNENLPDYGALVADDAVNFLKRFRRKTSRRISYYLCGEYGDRLKRPHYHAVLCGYPFRDRVRVGDRGGYPVWTSGVLASAWKAGAVELTSVSWKSASYVAGYVRKKVASRWKERLTRVDGETGEIIQLPPEFSSKSRNPALGRRWIERWWRDVYPRDEVSFNGLVMKPPRYYDRWMDQHHPEVMEEVRFKRYLASDGDVPDSELHAAEVTHVSRNRFFNKRGQYDE